MAKKQTVKPGTVSINLADMAAAIDRLNESTPNLDEMTKAMQAALKDAADDVMAQAVKAQAELLRRAREAAGPFGVGVRREREGRPVFEGGYTVCTKCNGLKRLNDCVWTAEAGNNFDLSDVEYRRFVRLGMTSDDLVPGTCKTCLKLDIEPLVTRAIELEDGQSFTITAEPGETITTESPIVMMEAPRGDVPVDVRFTDVGTSSDPDKPLGWLSAIGLETEEEIEKEVQARVAARKAMKERPIGVATTSGKAGELITIKLTNGVFELANEPTDAPVRRPMMINTGARETRYRDRNQPFPGKKQEQPNDVTKTRARQIVLDED